jgi:protein AATF/BFR2
MTTSKKSSTKYSLRDFDPENEDFGSEVSKSVSKKGASQQHGHLGDFKMAVKGGFTALDDKKYSGKPVSRSDLYGYESEEDDADEVDSESADESSASEKEEEEEEAILNDESKNLAAQLRNLEMQEDTQESFSLLHKSKVENRIEKSQNVRNQLIKFDNFVDVRFKMQPLVNTANAFPSSERLLGAKRVNSEVSKHLDSCTAELDGLMKDMLQLSFEELKNDQISVPQTDALSSDSVLQNYWNEMCRIDAALEPFARESLQKWHNKVSLQADLKAKKTLKMLNQDPFQQVQIAMQDEERLIRRTRLHRDTQKRRLGTPQQASEMQQEFADIYDDNDFYQVLLKDWTAAHGTLSNDSSIAAVVVKNIKKVHREGVDLRASKGRKLRFDVHAKLVNYMVPAVERGSWPDSKIDELYASLLGAK